MKEKNKKLKIWFILSPIFIIFFIVFIAYILLVSYQSDFYKKLENSSSTTTSELVKTSLEKNILDIQNEDRIIFDGSNPYLDDQRLMNYFAASLNQPTNYTYIFKMGKGKTSLKVLYSSSIDIKIGSYLPNEDNSLINEETITSLVNTNEYYTQNSFDNTRALYKLCKYFPESQLVVCIGTLREKHSILYARYFQSVIKEINDTKTTAILAELLLILLGALSISWIIKNAISDYEKSQDELKKINEELLLSNKALEDQLFVDTFTGLPNEKSLINDLSTMEDPKLMLIDIDDFRKMNEYYKQDIIEKLILKMKALLLPYTEEFNEYNIKLYRTDPSQFALLENAPIDMERYENIAIKLSEELKNSKITNDKGNIHLEFNCTIGFSLESSNTYETAAVALRRAKEREKDYLCYFKILGEQDRYRKQIHGADLIRKALLTDSIVPFFQPIFDKNKNIIKHECLMRIIDEDGNIISPYMFLTASKRIKRYADIAKIMITKCLDTIEGTDRIISLNLASRDVIDSEVKHFIIDEIMRRKLAKQVIFEIVEDESIESLERVALFIERAKAMGIKIAIDDFGSGYSNFSYMLSLQPDYVKIDGTLIKDLEHNKISRVIVSSIIHFTKELGIKTIAEFVHSERVFEICKELGIDEFQGFYLSTPREKIE